MFVVFLDVDGVLNTAAHRRAVKNNIDEVDWPDSMVRSENVQAYEKLTDPDSDLFVPDLRTVIHSSIRNDRDGLRSLGFFNAFFDGTPVIDLTPFPPADKISSIRNWLADHSVTRWAIVDDYLNLNETTPHIDIPETDGFTTADARALADYATGTFRRDGRFNLVPDSTLKRIKSGRTQTSEPAS